MDGRLSNWIATGVLDARNADHLDQQLPSVDAVEQWWGNLRRRGETGSPGTQLTYACLFLDRADAEGVPPRFTHIVALRLLIKAASRLLATAGRARNADSRLDGCLMLCDDSKRLLALSCGPAAAAVGVITAVELSKIKYELVRATQFVAETLEDVLAESVRSMQLPVVSRKSDAICEQMFSILERASVIDDTDPIHYVSANAFTLALMTAGPAVRELLIRRLASSEIRDQVNGDIAAHVALAWSSFWAARQAGDMDQCLQQFRNQNRDMCLNSLVSEDLFEKTVATAWIASLAEAGADSAAWTDNQDELVAWFVGGRRLRLAGRFLTEPSTRTRDVLDLAPGLFVMPHREDAMRGLVASFISQMDELAHYAPSLAGKYSALAVEAGNLRRQFGTPTTADDESQLQRSLNAIRALIEANESGWQLSSAFHDAYRAAQRLGADHALVSEAALSLAASVVDLVDLRPNQSWIWWRAYKLVTHWSLGPHLTSYDGTAKTPDGLDVARAVRERDAEKLRNRSAQVMWAHESLERVPGGRSRLYRPHRRDTHSYYHCVFKGFDTHRSAELERSALADCDEALRSVRKLLIADRETLAMMQRMHVPSLLGPVFERDGEYLIALESAGAVDLRAALSMDDGGRSLSDDMVAADAGLTIDVVCHELPVYMAFVQALLTVKAGHHLTEPGLRPKAFTGDCIKDPLKHGPFIWSSAERTAVDQALRGWAKDFTYGRKIDAHHGNVLVRRRHYSFIDFHYGRSARPSGYELIQLVENARLLPLTEESIEIRINMLSSYRQYLSAWVGLLNGREWQKPTAARLANDRRVVHRLMLYEAMRLLRQASAPEWRVVRPKDAAGMVEHADDILRVLATCDDASVSSVATYALKARKRYDRERVAVSKAAAKVLRHNASKVGADGWIPVEELCAILEGWAATTPRRLQLVRRKRIIEALCLPCEDRFEVTSDLKAIRALHGHTIANHPQLAAEAPPAFLYHGTSREAWTQIHADGLTATTRRFVHLFAEPGKAREHASRHDQPVVLEIDTAKALTSGTMFRRSNESVWLSDPVTPHCIRVIEAVSDVRRHES